MQKASVKKKTKQQRITKARAPQSEATARLLRPPRRSPAAPCCASCGTSAMRSPPPGTASSAHGPGPPTWPCGGSAGDVHVGMATPHPSGINFFGKTPKKIQTKRQKPFRQNFPPTEQKHSRKTSAKASHCGKKNNNIFLASLEH